MTPFVYSLILISAVFLWIICIGIVFLLIGCAILFACKVNQKVQKKSKCNKEHNCDNH